MLTKRGTRKMGPEAGQARRGLPVAKKKSASRGEPVSPGEATHCAAPRSEVVTGSNEHEHREARRGAVGRD